MKRRLLLVAAVLAVAVGGFGAAVALTAGATTGTATACATVAAQTVSANGSPVGTIPAASACTTVTYTVPTVTVTVGSTTTPTTTPTTTTQPTTTTTPTTTTQPASGAPWAWNAVTAALDPNSATLIQTFLGYALNNPNLTLNNYGVAVADSTSSSPCYTVPLSSGGSEDPAVCIPLGTKPDPSGDGHLTVRDTLHGRETDFWQAHYNSTTMEISGASAGVSFPLGAVNEQTAGWGGDAANLPLRRGLVTPDDILSGTINHPLVFSTPQIGGTSSGYRYPALHNSPTCGSSCTNHLVEGTWMRLDPAVNCNTLGLTSWQIMVCVALQNYGMFLRDNGGTMGIYGETPINGGTQWSAVGMSGNSVPFSSAFPWTHLQVLSPPG